MVMASSRTRRSLYAVLWQCACKATRGVRGHRLQRRMLLVRILGHLTKVYQLHQRVSFNVALFLCVVSVDVNDHATQSQLQAPHSIAHRLVVS